MAVVVLNKCRIVLRRLFIGGLGLTPHFTPHTEHQVNGDGEAASSSTEDSMKPWTLTWRHVRVCGTSAPFNSP